MAQDVIGRGVIELSADSSGLNAAVDKARKSIAGLGEASKSGSEKSAKSIDAYINRLKQQRDQLGMSAREMAAYKLAARGASDEQLRVADSIFAATERYKGSRDAVANLKNGFIATSAAALIAGTSFIAAMKGAIDYADELGDLSKKTGIGVEDLSGLSLAAKQSGTDLNGVADAISKLSQNIGKDEAKFRQLGITAKEPVEAFKQLADIFASVEDPQKRAALGAAALGKSWQSAAPLLAEGGQKIGEMVAKGRELSGITKEMTEEADKFNDELEVMKTRAGGAANVIAGPLVKSLNSLIAEMAAGTKIAGGFGNALMTFGFSSPIGTAAEQVRKYSDELSGLEASLARYRRAGSDTRAIDEAMIKTKQQLQFAQARANAEAMEGGYRGKGFSDPRILKDPVDTSKVDDFIKEPKAPKGGGGIDTLAQEAKAQLAFDLDQIRRATEVEIGIYANSEKVMEAMRSASLIDERQYYQEKLGFIQLNSQAQEASLIKERERLQAEKLAGKDLIDNQRQILDVESKLARVRAESAANQQVLKIQETDYLDRIKRGFIEAEAAARSYLDTTRQQYARDLDGIGQGEQTRRRNAGRAQVEDTYAQQLLQLASEKRQGAFAGREEQYAQEVERIKRFQAEALALYANYYDGLIEKQGSWALGASEALANYADESRNTFASVNDLVSDAFRGAEDALVEFTQTGKLSLKDMLASINADIARMAIRESITGPLAGYLKESIGALGKTGSGGAIGSIAGAASTSGQTAALTASTAAITAQTTAATSGAAAITLLTEAAYAAASSLSMVSTSGGGGGSSSGIASLLGSAISAYAGGGLSVETVASGAVSSNYNEMPNFLRGGRAIGGPVSAGGLYQVNEKGPELLQVAGKEYLMMGSQSGTVKPNAAAASEKPMVVQNTFMVHGQTDRSSQAQIATAAGQGISRAMRRNG